MCNSSYFYPHNVINMLQYTLLGIKKKNTNMVILIFTVINDNVISNNDSIKQLLFKT